jgi:hypothetical protein
MDKDHFKTPAGILINAWSRMFLEQLIVSQLLNKYDASY